jgi:hypothetical protein
MFSKWSNKEACSMKTHWLAAHRSMQEGVAEVDKEYNTRCAMSVKKGWGGEAKRGGSIHSTACIINTDTSRHHVH